ncbi:MAG: hypothetical protein ROZ09_11675 [Thiobacillus sp.]|uniref:phage tail terminator protein n=1 Tax=Thiobacillus sp. TaxID=924 RepID=UPI0028961F40|nr:hypothetical protein [Thiobacillus sp.]MDT3707479.1 hypothetical protein [Thiobacillus sp.]
MIEDYLAAGALIEDRIRDKVPEIRRVEGVGDLTTLLENDAEEFLKQISGKLPSAFVGFDGETIGDMAGNGSDHVAGQRYLVVLAVGNYRRADTNKGVVDTAGPLLSKLVAALSGWKPMGFTELIRQAAPRPGYRAGVGFFPLVFTTDLFVEGLTE